MVCFFKDAITDLINDFRVNYFSDTCIATKSSIEAALNQTGAIASESVCRRDSSVLAIVLLVGTLWLALTVLQLRESPYLSRVLREVVSEYALPIGVIVFR